MKKLSSLSFFMPCYNEEKNIKLAVLKAYKVLPQISNKSEVIVINDGSNDKSAEILKKLKIKFSNLYIVNHKNNLGYGAALKSGFNKSKYEWIFFTDSDLQFDYDQINDLVKFSDKFEAVFGYRKKRAEGIKRALNMWGYNFMINLFFGLEIKDVDCAFKLIKTSKVKNLKLESNGAFLSTEFVYKLKNSGVKFKQIPVKHKLRKFGQPTGGNLKVILKALRELFDFFVKVNFK